MNETTVRLLCGGSRFAVGFRVYLRIFAPLALRRPVGRGDAGVRCGCLELQKREKGVNSHFAKR